MADGETFRRSEVLMDTLVSIEVVDPESTDACAVDVGRAFEWFRQVEAHSTRFDERSEVMSLRTKVGVAVPVSPLLFEAIRFALSVAEESGGAFDPMVGYALERRGFNRNYRTGELVTSDLGDDAITYRDVILDPAKQTVTLRRPGIFDLGAVVKGMAIDLAANQLAAYPNVAIDAGGDIYVRGHNRSGEPWRVGIRHPREPGALLLTVQVADGAVCTSGDYERPAAEVGEHHIVDPRTGHSAARVASVTVIGPNAMVADSLGTAAFVLGPERGISFLEANGVDGLIVTGDLVQHQTSGFARYSR
jgi:thiamine biosynthesis lipoprotein